MLLSSLRAHAQRRRQFQNDLISTVRLYSQAQLTDFWRPHASGGARTTSPYPPRFPRLRRLLVAVQRMLLQPSPHLPLRELPALPLHKSSARAPCPDTGPRVCLERAFVRPLCRPVGSLVPHCSIGPAQ